MEHVRYIDKTRDYYRAQGYTKDYGWATNDEAPFTPLRKPVAEARIGLVSTVSIVRLDEAGEPTETSRIMGSNKLEVFTMPTDFPVERLRSMSEDHDRFQSDMADVNAYLPKDHLRTFAEEGRIGSTPDVIWRILPNYSKRKVTNVDAPELERQMKDAGVDAVVLTPV